MTRPIWTLAHLAYHEAAHAIVAAALDLPPIARVEIREDDGMLSGQCVHDPPWPAVGWRHFALYALAGAHGHLAAGGLPEDVAAGAASDRAGAVEYGMSAGLPREEVERTIATDLDARSAILVGQHWGAIQQLASQLIEQRTIDRSST